MRRLFCSRISLYKTRRYAIPRFMINVTALNFADFLVTAFIALVIGLLFSWWAGAIAFWLGLELLFRPSGQWAPWQHTLPEDEKTAKELLEWNAWEVTYGPSAPGIANPTRRED